MSTIQFVDLKKQYAPYKEEILSGIEQILDGMQLYLGENTRALDIEFSQFCGTKHGISVCDGTAALHVILRAMGIGTGDEVITVSHTFIATTEAIILAGARPVFVDIKPGTFLMDTEQIEAKITPRTKAILPVHLYGQTVDMDPIMDIAKKHHLKVIEDACQAHGAEYKGKKAGNLGDAAGFSFYYSKNLGAYGEGGFITTNDDEISRLCKMMREHGSEIRYHHEIIGFNARLDEIQAHVCRVKLPRLSEWNQSRVKHAKLYDQLLAGTPAITPSVSQGCSPVYHLYVIRVQKEMNCRCT